MKHIENICLIFEGEAKKGEDPYEKQRYARDVNRNSRGKHPQWAVDISFTDKDLEGITTSHHDPLVISPVIQRRDNGYSRLARVLVDIGASVNVLYWDAFLNLRLREEDLKSSTKSVKGFSQAKIRSQEPSPY